MSDVKQVREAAQYINDHESTQWFGCCLGENEDYTKAAELLAQAYIAEHPEDDDALVDVVWMDKCKKLFTNDADDGVVYFDRCEGIEICISGSDIVLMFCGVTLIESPTRGDVRRLANALRVDLGEKQ